MTLDDFLNRLEGVRKSAGGWMARCPAHEDRRQSLSVSLGEDRILLNCFAHCEPKDVVAKLGLRLRDLFFNEQPREGKPRPKDRFGPPEAAYPYTDEQSVLLSEVVRYPGKKFCQRRPDGKGGWTYKLDGVRRVVYRLPEILAANPSRVVFVCEGEKDVDNLRSLGEIATTNPGGTGSGRLWEIPTFREPLRSRVVVILPDNDEPGRKHTVRVAAALHGCASLVKILTLPELPAKGDVSDWIEAGGTQNKLHALAAATEPWTPPTHSQSDTGDKDEDDGDKRERPTQARLLVALAQEHADLFRDTGDEPYATIRQGETLAIRSKGFRGFLVEKFFLTHDKTPSSQALKEAMETLETLAKLSPAIRTVALRIGAQDDCLFVDLGDAKRRIVEIKPGSWRVVSPEDVAIRFRRTSTMRPLPEPIREGDINDLRRFLNFGDEEWRWRLLLTWLLFTFQPKGPFPVLVLQGEQGCAKSTAARVLRALIDPSQAPLRLAPRDENNLLVAAKSSWVLAFDNLSGMPTWLSDCLCCLATGTAQSKRALYTDDEEHIIEATRPVIVNGIDDMTARPDFASRALAVALPQIQDEQRQEEAAFWADFFTAQPGILAGALSTVAGILAIREQVILAAKPRMADFARFGVAAEQVLGWPRGSFLDAYQASQADSAAVTLESNLVALAVHRFMNDPDLDLPEWEDSASALLPRLAAQLGAGQERNRAWPVNASQLGNQLRRCAPILRRYGIEADQIRSHGERRWRLTRVEADARAKTTSPPAPFREPEQFPLLGTGGRGDGRNQAPDLPCHPQRNEVTAGAVGVTASDAAASPRCGTVGAGQDGASFLALKRKERAPAKAMTPLRPEASREHFRRG
jgi:hypothetical protein